MNIAEVRAKYPQYQDLSDEALVKGLHSKFYADLPYEQFAEKVGLKAPAPVSDKSKPLPANAGLANFMAHTLGLPVDTVENAINLGVAAVGKSTGTTPDLLSGSVGGSEWLKGKLKATGEPGLNPDNPNPESGAGTAQYDLVSRGGFIPGGAIPAAGSMLAEKVLGPEYAGVGAMTPQAVSQAASAAKTAVANPKVVRENIDTFKKVGTTPDVAQATDSNFFRGLTNVVARIPGGQGVITKFREMEQKALGDAAKTGTSAESAGRAIREGVTGEGGFIERTKAQWLNLDQKLADKIGTEYKAPPTNTLAALDDLVKVIPGAEKSTQSLVNPKIAEFRTALLEDTKGNLGGVPFEALRALRTKVGSMLDDSLVSGIPNGELKKLYGALSKDIEQAAGAVGAKEEFTRQSNYYKARMDRIENTLDSVLGKGKDPEAIFKAVAPTDVESVNKVRRVMRSLDPEERKIVSDAVVNRLGRAVPGKQDITGEKFSSETFLSNWSRINDSAKSQLFPDPAMRARLDSIAKVSGDIRDGKTPFANNSGTGQAITAGSVYGSIPAAAGLAVTGNVPAAVTALTIAGSLVVSANIGARMLTSPKVVDWLAKAPKASTPEQLSAHLGRLAVIYSETKDQSLKQELGSYLQSVSPQ